MTSVTAVCTAEYYAAVKRIAPFHSDMERSSGQSETSKVETMGHHALLCFARTL